MIIIRKSYSTAMLLLVCIVVVFSLLTSINLMTPPDSKPENTPPTEFSAARAIKHITPISQDIHITGSTQNEKVRKYIIDKLKKMDLDSTVEQKLMYSELWGENFNVQNIICRIPGTENHNLVTLFSAHYDSFFTGKGASDDGIGVAALLETIRAIKAGPPLKNDLIFLFTDGEEPVLLGAKAFVEDSKTLLKDIKVAVNFDNSGNHGVAFANFISNKNEALTKDISKASIGSTIFSSMYEITRIIPPGADITVFDAAGIPSINFCSNVGRENGHTPTDTVENLDIKTLQHEGEYAIALAHNFGNADRLDFKACGNSNGIFFPIIKGLVIFYSDNWIIPVTIFLIILEIVAFILAFRNKIITFKGIISWMAAFLIEGIVCSFLTWLLIQLMGVIFKQKMSLFLIMNLYPSLCMIGFVMLLIAVVSITFSMYFKRHSFEDFLLGITIILSLLSLATCFTFKGFSYLFNWPLLIGISTELLLFSYQKYSIIKVLAYILLLITTALNIVLYFPVAYLSYWGGLLEKSPFIIFFLALPVSYITGLFYRFTSKTKRALPIGASILSILLICFGIIGALNKLK